MRKNQVRNNFVSNIVSNLSILFLDTLVIVLTVLCIVGALLLLGSIIVYGYIRIKMGKRTNRMERHEMSMQGPILEVVRYLSLSLHFLKYQFFLG